MCARILSFLVRARTHTRLLWCVQYSHLCRYCFCSCIWQRANMTAERLLPFVNARTNKVAINYDETNTQMSNSNEQCAIFFTGIECAAVAVADECAFHDKHHQLLVNRARKKKYYESKWNEARQKKWCETTHKQNCFYCIYERIPNTYNNIMT